MGCPIITCCWMPGRPVPPVAQYYLKSKKPVAQYLAHMCQFSVFWKKKQFSDDLFGLHRLECITKIDWSWSPLPVRLFLSMTQPLNLMTKLDEAWAETFEVSSQTGATQHGRKPCTRNFESEVSPLSMSPIGAASVLCAFVGTADVFQRFCKIHPCVITRLPWDIISSLPTTPVDQSSHTKDRKSTRLVSELLSDTVTLSVAVLV